MNPYFLDRIQSHIRVIFKTLCLQKRIQRYYTGCLWQNLGYFKPSVAINSYSSNNKNIAKNLLHVMIYLEAFGLPRRNQMYLQLQPAWETHVCGEIRNPLSNPRSLRSSLCQGGKLFYTLMWTRTLTHRRKLKKRVPLYPCLSFPRHLCLGCSDA